MCNLKTNQPTNQLIEPEYRGVLVRGGGEGKGQMGEGGQKVQTSNYKINTEDVMYGMT